MKTIPPLSHPPGSSEFQPVQCTLEKDAFRAWFRLLETPGLGRRSAAALLAHWGCAQQVLAASVEQWGQVVGPIAAQVLQSPPDPTYLQRQETAWRWLQSSNPSDAGPRSIVTWGHPDYPQSLATMPDPPLMLYVVGSHLAWQSPGLAIVGSRNPTAQGLDNARSFARALSRSGLCIVSGLALGVDGAAHEGALDAGATTVAVVGTGLERVYPRRHQDLARRIVEQGGALLSEFPPGMPVRQENFPMRNRIIAGMTWGTLVVEAAVESGSLITAKLALDAGREVFAVPGSIHTPQSKGCHALIRQGAKLVETASDILEELPSGLLSRQGQLFQGFLQSPGSPQPESGASGAATQGSAPCLQALGHDPITPDALALRSGMPVAQLAAQLLELELLGHVARLPGGLFQRRVNG